MANTCCCGTGTTGSSCLNGYPEMVISITASDANLPVTWCGITWQKSTYTPLGSSDRSSGQVATICPTTYFKGVQTTPTVIYSHAWLYGTGAATTGLRMGRRLATNLFPPNRWGNTLYLRNDGKDYRYGFLPPYTSTIIIYSTLNKILGVSPATTGNYLLTNDYFGSYTSPSGVQYTWSRGAGWP
jgi:hypothetical protein